VQLLANTHFLSQQRSFYVTAGSIASAYILYRISAASQESGSESFIASLVNKYSTPQEILEQRNAIHTALLEKAAEDRHLLQSQGPREFIELKQPEYVGSDCWIGMSIANFCTACSMLAPHITFPPVPRPT
jgi:hypothetical protein